MLMDIRFEALNAANYKLLKKWLAAPHIQEFWGKGETWDVSASKYLSLINTASVKPFLIYIDKTAVGYIQYYWAHLVGDGWWEDYPPDVVGCDQFVGELNFLGKGFGEKVLSQFLKKLFSDNSINRVIVDPSPENKRAIRCYEKVGFKSCGKVKTPDGLALLMDVRR